jgi:hypothetical protein
MTLSFACACVCVCVFVRARTCQATSRIGALLEVIQHYDLDAVIRFFAEPV